MPDYSLWQRAVRRLSLLPLIVLSSGADYDSPAKRAEAKKAGRTLEFDYGSVYCHQGCAGGFTDVLGTTARNPGAKR